MSENGRPQINGGRTYGLPENSPFQESSTYSRQNLSGMNMNGHTGNVYGLPSLPENDEYYPSVDFRQNLAMMNGGGQLNSVAGSPVYQRAPLQENNQFQIPPPDMDTYSPAVVNGRQTLSMMNTGGGQVNSAAGSQVYCRPWLPEFNPGFRAGVNGGQSLRTMNGNSRNVVNPSFLDQYYDFSLESDFNRLSLSNNNNTPNFTPPPPSPGRGGVSSGGIDGQILPDDFLVNPQISYADLQRMRIQSAAMAQIMNLYNRPRNFQSLDAASDQISRYDRTGESPRYNLARPRSTLGSSILPRYGNGRNPSLSRNGLTNESNYGSLRLWSSLTSLEDLSGNIFLAAKDQRGCVFLQTKIEERKPEDILIIFSEVKDHVCELMVDQIGSCLIRKLFEVCNQHQIDELLLLVVQDERTLMTVCLDVQGTRAMQKLIENIISQDQRSIIISGIRRITVPLTKSSTGHHVIQQCLKFFSSEDTKPILNAVADNCFDIAIDKSGCCVIQNCVSHAEGESRDRLIQEIILHASVLSVHPYGNYVVQYVLSLQIPHVTKDILNRLSGSYTPLSMSKYGSNVVEKCLKESQEEDASKIVKELFNDPQWLTVIQHPFGNYVAQSALEVAKGAMLNAMVEFINSYYPFLNSHPHGKRVLACTRRMKNRG